MTNKEKFEQVFNEDIIKLWYKPASLFMSWCAEDYDDTKAGRESVRINIDYNQLAQAVYRGVKAALAEAQLLK